MTTRTLSATTLALVVCLMPASAQRGEFVQTPWPKPALPASENYTVQGRVQFFGDDANACCASIAATPIVMMEDALAAACRKSFGSAVVPKEGSAKIDPGSCRAEVAPADSAAPYRCSAPLTGRCMAK